MNHKYFIRFPLLLSLIIASIMIHHVGYATTFYIDATQGDNAYSGTSPAEAWKTIARVNNASFQPGDSILFQRGEVWTGESGLRVQSAGENGNRIVIGAYGTGAKPVFNGEDTWNIGIFLEASYLKLENIVIRDVGSQKTGYNEQGIHVWTRGEWVYDIVIDSCEVYSIGGQEAIMARHYDGLVIRNNIIDDCYGGIVPHGTEINPGTNTLIEYNRVSNSSDGIVPHKGDPTVPEDLGKHHVIRYNECFNNAQQGIDMNSGQDMHVYGNDVYGNGTYGISISVNNKTLVERNDIHDNANGISIDNQNHTIRFNMIYNNNGDGIDIANAERWGIEPQTNNVEIYNNTLYGNDGEEITFMLTETADSTRPKNLKIVNNIFHARGAGLIINNSSDYNFDRYDWEIDYNIYYGTGSDTHFRNRNTSSYHSLSEMQSLFNQDINSIEVDPLKVFADATMSDFSLMKDSPAINVGNNEILIGIPNVKDFNGTQITDSNGNIVIPDGQIDAGAIEYTGSDNSTAQLGDVDFNGTVQSYDAAITLQYSLGMDPYDGDPAPWSDDREIVADVDGNGSIQAYDSALIQQYVIGMLETFPGEN